MSHWVYVYDSDRRVLLDVKVFETDLAAGLFSADRLSAGFATTDVEYDDEWTDQCHAADRAKERSE